ncbi:MAG: hypothetical protein IT378_25550 [Sandaracinaceae bacterium]|nr:hypothetical protein [Sandaracinaceae bacterium]
MPLPAAEPLFDALCALRDAADPSASEHRARWRTIARWLEQAFAGASAEHDEARQATLISLLRHVHELRAESPLQAAKWVAVIHRRKRVDLARRRAADPVHGALRHERAQERGDARGALIDRVAAEESLAGDPALIEQVVERVLFHVARDLEETERNAAKRLLRATQAQACLLRVVHEADAGAIAAALDVGEPLTKERIYKWVERGRPVVLAAIARWEREAEPEDREHVAEVARALREIVEERRADAGIARPARRKEVGE